MEVEKWRIDHIQVLIPVQVISTNCPSGRENVIGLSSRYLEMARYLGSVGLSFSLLFAT